jgi:hypothetical protein
MMNNYPLEVYSEKYWEIFDPGNAEVIAHVFDKDHAELIAKLLNDMRLPK